jgi:hypothetical protein
MRRPTPALHCCGNASRRRSNISLNTETLKKAIIHNVLRHSSAPPAGARKVLHKGLISAAPPAGEQPSTDVAPSRLKAFLQAIDIA